MAKPLIQQEPSAGSALGSLARELYRERRLRDACLPGDLFGEAAWDLLLDLFASAEEGRTVRVSSACIAAAVPASTALRYLAEMERTGLITRSPSPGDKRGQIVRLTASGHGDMRELLKRIRSSRAHPSSADC